MSCWRMFILVLSAAVSSLSLAQFVEQNNDPVLAGSEQAAKKLDQNNNEQIAERQSQAVQKNTTSSQPASASTSIEKFTPSKTISIDNAVTFPADI